MSVKTMVVHFVAITAALTLSGWGGCGGKDKSGSGDIPAGGGGSAPGSFTLSTPASASTGVSLTPSFTWTDSLGETYYILQVSTSSAFTGSLVHEDPAIPQDTTFHTLPAGLLTTGTLYFWRVIARNSVGETTATNAPFSFITGITDATPPTVTNVSSSTANGTYGAGTTIPVVITFSETVNVSGTPQLALETGATDALANYAGGSGSATLTFNYVVAAGHSSADLDYTSTGALALNGGAIQDLAANNATLTLPAPGSAGSLAANKALVINTAPVLGPSVTSVTSPVLNNTYGSGAVIPVNVLFTAPVDVTGTPQITLETGASDAVVNYSSGSGTPTLTFSYTVATGHASADLDYLSTAALQLNGGTISGPGGAANLALPAPGAAGSLGANKDIVISTAAPAVPVVTNVTSSTPNGTYGVSTTIPIQVTFSEVVNVAGGTPQLTLQTSLANYAGGSGTSTLTFNYIVGAGQNATDLDYASASALVLNGATIQDTDTNNANLALPAPGAAGSLASNKNIVIDTMAPAVPAAPDLAPASDTGASNTDNITSLSTLTFTGSTEANASVNLYAQGSGTPSATAQANGSGQYSLTASFTLTPPGTFSLVFVVTSTDAAGNATTSSPALMVTVDNASPLPPSAPNLTDASDTGTNSSDDLTNDTTPTFSGTAEANASVTLYASGTAVQTTPATGGSYTLTSTSLAAGLYAFTAIATDVAGNQSISSAALPVTIDSSIATPLAPDLTSASDTGPSDTDNITDDTTPTFTGTTEPWATVNLYTGVTQRGTATATGAGAYTVTASTLTAGTYSFSVIATDVAGNISASSPGLSVTIGAAGPDTTAPSQVTSLTVDSITTTTVTLSWFAPGDDAAIGTATSYDIRYWTVPMTTDPLFNAANQLTGEPAPASAGSPQTFTVNLALSPATTYYFALKAVDDNSNWSTISNSAAGTPQAPAPPWAKSYGGQYWEMASAIRSTSDGGYVMAGYTDTWSVAQIDFWLVKTTADGTPVWQKAYGAPGNDWAYAVSPTTDNAFVAAGICTPGSTTDAWVVKVNATNGNLIWEKRYGGAENEEAKAVFQTADGGYLVAGNTNSFGAGAHDAWMMKLNADGTVAWSKTYGGASNDQIRSMVRTADGGAIAAGYTNSFGAGSEDVWVLKVDSAGDVDWQKTYGTSNSELAEAVTALPGGGYVFAGRAIDAAGDSDYWVVRMDASGSVSWQERLGGSSPDFAYALSPNGSGGIAVTGVTYSFGSSSSDAWILSLNGNGSVQSQKYFGGASGETAYAIQEIPGLGFVTAGFTGSFGQGIEAWILRLASDMTVSSLGTTTTATPANTTATATDTSVSPANVPMMPTDTTATVTVTTALPQQQAP
ncbi:MAG: hypothetical protein HYY16_00075 [Planctomycetes bacterium]|nr:hypothetical protein [Planctomycetota bacterium]